MPQVRPQNVAAHRSTPLRGACDQLAHFLVGGLREIFVKLPDCLEIFRRDRAPAVLFVPLPMGDKLSHDEVSARGGRSRSPAKLEAVRNNLEKAKATLAARRAARTESADTSADDCGPGNDCPAGPRLIL
jgi:hypothetical protein